MSFPLANVPHAAAAVVHRNFLDERHEVNGEDIAPFICVAGGSANSAATTIERSSPPCWHRGGGRKVLLAAVAGVFLVAAAVAPVDVTLASPVVAKALLGSAPNRSSGLTVRDLLESGDVAEVVTENILSFVKANGALGTNASAAQGQQRSSTPLLRRADVNAAVSAGLRDVSTWVQERFPTSARRLEEAVLTEEQRDAVLDTMRRLRNPHLQRLGRRVAFAVRDALATSSTPEVAAARVAASIAGRRIELKAFRAVLLPPESSKRRVVSGNRGSIYRRPPTQWLANPTWLRQMARFGQKLIADARQAGPQHSATASLLAVATATGARGATESASRRQLAETQVVACGKMSVQGAGVHNGAGVDLRTVSNVSTPHPFRAMCGQKLPSPTFDETLLDEGPLSKPVTTFAAFGGDSGRPPQTTIDVLGGIESVLDTNSRATDAGSGVVEVGKHEKVLSATTHGTAHNFAPELISLHDGAIVSSTSFATVNPPGFTASYSTSAAPHGESLPNAALRGGHYVRGAFKTSGKWQASTPPNDHYVGSDEPVPTADTGDVKEPTRPTLGRDHLRSGELSTDASGSHNAMQSEEGLLTNVRIRSGDFGVTPERAVPHMLDGPSQIGQMLNLVSSDSLGGSAATAGSLFQQAMMMSEHLQTAIAGHAATFWESVLAMAVEEEFPLASIAQGFQNFSFASMLECVERELNWPRIRSLELQPAIVGCPAAYANAGIEAMKLVGREFFPSVRLFADDAQGHGVGDATMAAAIDLSACLAGEALVHVEGRGPTAAADLVVGHRVLVASLQGEGGVTTTFEPVIGFLHKLRPIAGVHPEILVVTHECGELRVSERHLVFLSLGPNGDAPWRDVLASELRVGDALLVAAPPADCADGNQCDAVAVRTQTSQTPWSSSLLLRQRRTSRVLAVRRSVAVRGLVAPMTASGIIAANNVVVSTYAVPFRMRQIPHVACHTALFAARALGSLLLSLRALFDCDSLTRSPFCERIVGSEIHSPSELHPYAAALWTSFGPIAAEN
eukprot:TRINITY_DN20653_c0_g1_i1.p1 TRINITY_DN20653_c0_g1~~TRINITY_DN20653_c0_g1_i1.p1  ORF type:complete len:1023 (-),score=143.06 TRINITY_DN20653_c0_g1_i1:455-3523(-)